MKTDYECANCSMKLLELRPADMIQAKPGVGDLLVCGGCATINEVTLLGTETLSAESFDALDDETKRDLNFAIRAVVRKIRQS